MIPFYKILKKDDASALRTFVDGINFDRLQESYGWRKAIESLESEDNRYVVSGEFVNDRITSAAISYSIDSIWKSDKHLMPYWAIGAYRNIDSETPLRKRTDNLVGPVVNHFESKGFYSFFMSRMVPVRLVNENIDRIFQRMSNLGFCIERYDCRIETVLDQSLEWQNLPSLYKAVSFDTCTPEKRVVVLRFDLKTEFRKYK